MRPRAAFAAVLVAGLAACGGGEETRPLPEDVEGTVAQTTTQQEGGGNGEQGDASAGKKVFASAGCGSCHALSDAGTSGTVGPDLDESKPDYELAVDRVTNGQGAMPSFKDQLSDKEIKDVATYVVQATKG